MLARDEFSFGKTFNVILNIHKFTCIFFNDVELRKF